MPRAEVGTPKWLANKMKAKGLQKLRWYCQMCEKQCRDENGFKCHRMSEGHQRQMQVFCQHPDKFMDEFSSVFEKDFMKLMRTRYCRTRILANTVYNEMISDREHVHMNSTIWVTLSEFIQYLGHSGKCKLDLTPKGWYIEYIDRERIERERLEASRRKQELTIEETNDRRMKKLIEEAQSRGAYQQTAFTGLERKEDEKISFAALKSTKATRISAATKKLNENILLQESIAAKDKCSSDSTKIKNQNSSGTKRKLSNIDLLMMKQQSAKENKRSKEASNTSKDEKRASATSTSIIAHNSQFFPDSCWLSEGIIVKVTDESFSNGKYQNCKGTVKRVLSRQVPTLNMGEIELFDPEVTIRISQESVETVIPTIGGMVRIVRGQWNGNEGELLMVNIEEYCASVKLSRGPHFEKPESSNLIPFTVYGLQFEDICKVSMAIQ
ncbi:Dna/Rna-binding protein KIN17 domain-containing protein [Cardiosporidium cionae]|uniref:Dna/Rna-binding protein KIN17 domain-containing protein n=1 Tax=Cardiosporidium cionae TaxID=476202 RepID=A0ABQ7JAF0_9APIC|nr:Dna/Rna-binding protein KIN17 domain-containing protein [Cardiosporidium cionae]|eukprot:KAF8820966.1 Dna/Rna-binding protein KIN17 domain-containing protein [Cardiosporidium cionae]